MVDLDELDRLHAALPELCGRAEVDAWSPTVFAVVAEGPLSANRRSDVSPSMGEVAVAAVILLNAYPAMAAELRERRAREEALAAELRALREVAEAAREVSEYHRVYGTETIQDVNVDALRAALAKVPR